MRKELDVVYLGMARLISYRSTCARKQVGSIIASASGRIISSGWNGVAPGKEHCCDLFDSLSEDFYIEHGKFSASNEIHSEMNAILNADREKLIGATLYVTLSPCINCAKIIVASGINSVVYMEIYDRDKEGLEFLAKNKIIIRQIAEQELLEKI